MHIISLVEMLAFLLNHLQLANSALQCSILNYAVSITYQLEMLCLLLCLSIQVSTMIKALQVPRHWFIARSSWLFPKSVNIIPVLVLFLNCCFWNSKYERQDDPSCYMELPWHNRWVFLIEIILNIWANLVYLISFLVQTHQATYLAKQLECDFKELNNAGCPKSLFHLKLDAVRCRKKAKSASKRNVVIGINATLWSAYAVIAYSWIMFTRENSEIKRYSARFW